MSLPIKAVLFDLDGTLIDSAPDLGASADKMRTDRGLPSYPFERYRNMAGAGAPGMLLIAFGIKPGDEHFEDMREEFYSNYEACMAQHTFLFDGIETMIKALEARRMPWGIVTNKTKRFTIPMMRHATWAAGAGTVISGDTMPHMKPHPAPVLEGARQLAIAPEHCLFVGDDLRDIQSGNAAQMQTAAVTWGYLGANRDVSAWGANHILNTPADILKLLE